MQAVMNFAQTDGGNRIHFAGGRDYMMRSEKRGGARQPVSGGSGKKPPKRRRRRAGFCYKLLTMLLLLVLWPVGLLMLWRRKVRWGVGTKLLTSAITLIACVVLIGFALTVDTGNARYATMQNSANDFLEDAADSLVIAWEEVKTRAMIATDSMQNMADAVWQNVRIELADGIDTGVKLGTSARETIADRLAGSDGEGEKIQESAEPESSSTPQPESSAAPEATTPPVAQITIGADTQQLPVYIPEITPEAGKTLRSGALNRSGEIDVSGAPLPLAEADAAPVFIVKPAANATVYYNDGGKCYHMSSACGSMQSADEHTLGETLGSSVHRCSACKTPDKHILDEAYIVWVDEDRTAHLSDECTKFDGKWSLVSADEAIAEGLVACYECEADQYLAAIALKQEIRLEAPTAADDEAADAQALNDEADDAATDAPSAEPTNEPSVEPSNKPSTEPSVAPSTEAANEATADSTVEPSAEAASEATAEPSTEPSTKPSVAPSAESTVEPTATLKPAALATVYHTKNGKWYHRVQNCSGMLGASAYTLEESLAHFKACNSCKAPTDELIEQDCVWTDENGLCHTSDECEHFEGAYTLISLADALEQELSGCASCFADEYLSKRAAAPAEGRTDGNVVYYEDILVVEATAAH